MKNTSAFLLLLAFACVQSLFAQPEPAQDSASAPPAAVSTGVLDTRLSTIQYESGSISLSLKDKEELDYIVQMMQLNPSLVLRIQGHSDDKGPLEQHEYLSKFRAWLVWAYLVAHEVPHHRVSYYGFGYRRPLVAGTSEKAREANRRVEIHVVLPSKPSKE